MPESRLSYERLVENALRNVVREALREVAARGLPGEHHFYVSFRTGHAGVTIPDYLRAQYPQEMTIVLQHQFWGLEIEDASFSVTLSFNNRHERLTVPFAAIGYFEDPAVKFRLQFEVGETAKDKERSVRSGAGETHEAASTQRTADGKSADVVTLDAFRKK